MKSNSRKLINLIKVGLDIIWYLNFFAATIALIFLMYIFLTKEYSDMDIKVQIPAQELNKVASSSHSVKDVVLKTKEATLHMQVKNTLWQIIASLFSFFVIEFLVINIIFHLRKLFRGLNNGYAFTYENVVILRRIAIFVALIWPLGLIAHLFLNVIIGNCISSPLPLTASQSSYDYKIILIAAILYIIAEVFNSGLELKKENEEFV